MENFSQLKMKMPKTLYLKTVDDFKMWEEILNTLAEKYLTSDWSWSFKVGGKVMREIREIEENNEGLVIIGKYMKDNKFLDLPSLGGGGESQDEKHNESLKKETFYESR